MPNFLSILEILTHIISLRVPPGSQIEFDGVGRGVDDLLSGCVEETLLFADHESRQT